MRASSDASVEILEARRVDQREVEIAQPPLRLAPVARDARRVIDKRELPARQAVEQRGFADIGPADDGELDHGVMEHGARYHPIPATL